MPHITPSEAKSKRSETFCSTVSKSGALAMKGEGLLWEGWEGGPPSPFRAARLTSSEPAGRIPTPNPVSHHCAAGNNTHSRSAHVTTARTTAQPGVLGPISVFPTLSLFWQIFGPLKSDSRGCIVFFGIRNYKVIVNICTWAPKAKKGFDDCHEIVCVQVEAGRGS